MGATLHQGNILLVGDAAGLVNPLTGEGIRYAIGSAQIAAETIVSGQVADYSRRIYKQIGYDLRFSYLIKAAFNAWPRFCYRHLVKSAAASRTLSLAFCGDLTFKELFFKAGRKMINPLNYVRAGRG